MGMLLCLAWQERQIKGWVVKRCPDQITPITPKRVRRGPMTTMTHFDPNIFLTLTFFIDVLILLKISIDFSL
jgi:hypothetical protein